MLYIGGGSLHSDEVGHQGTEQVVFNLLLDLQVHDVGPIRKPILILC